MTCEEVKQQFDAYVDLELDAESAAAVRLHTRQCVDCRRRVAEWQALRELIRATPLRAAPPRLRARISARAARPRLLRGAAVWTTAAVLLLAAGAGIGSLGSSLGRGELVSREVVDNHVRSLLADHIYDVESTDAHTVKPWFVGKLTYSPSVVDLATAGFPLAGGRLDYLAGRPVAALVYTRRRHTINVFIAPEDASPDRGAAFRNVHGFNIHHWRQNGMSFWAVSDLNDAELTEFVRALQGS